MTWGRGNPAREAGWKSSAPQERGGTGSAAGVPSVLSRALWGTRAGQTGYSLTASMPTGARQGVWGARRSDHGSCHPRDTARPTAPPPGPSLRPRPQLPRGLPLSSSEMRRCEGYGGTRDGLAGKMDERGREASRRLGQEGQASRGGGYAECARLCTARVSERRVCTCARERLRGIGAWVHLCACGLACPCAHRRGGAVSHHTDRS